MQEIEITKSYKSKRLNYIFFIISPLISLIFAFLNYRKQYAKNILMFFCSFFGLTYALKFEGNDLNTYIERFELISSWSWSNFQEQLINYISLSGNVDFIETIIYFALSRISDNSIMLMAFFGLFFGFFYSRNTYYLLSLTKYKLNFYSLVFFISIFLIISPYQGVNQFRFYTASAIYFYGILNYFFFSKKMAIWFLLLAGMTHFSLLILLIPFVAYLIIGRYFKICVLLFGISFIFSEFDFSIFENMVSYMGESFQIRFNTYTSDLAFQRLAELESRAWYISLWQPFMRYSFGVAFLLLILKQKIKYSSNFRFFSFVLLLFSVVNIMAFSSMNFRFFHTLFLFCFSVLLLLFEHLDNRTIKKVFYIMLPSILLMAIFQIRGILVSINAYIFVSNPLNFYLFGNEYALIDLFRRT